MAKPKKKAKQPKKKPKKKPLADKQQLERAMKGYRRPTLEEMIGTAREGTSPLAFEIGQMALRKVDRKK